MHGIVNDAYKARMNESHTREFRLRSYRWTPNLGGGPGTSEWLKLILPGGREVGDIPIEDGDLTVDSTDPHTRRLRVVVPGEEWIPTSATSPLAPFGQFLSLHVRLDDADGNWLPWIKLGEFPIIGNTIDRPSGTVTIEAVDWSHRVDEFGFERIFTCPRDTSVEQDVRQIVDQALPHKVYSTLVAGNAKTVYHDQKETATFGQGRWEFVRSICQANGLEALFDRNGDLVIRNAIFDADGFTTGVPDHDIGSVSNPVGLLNEDDGGNIVALRPKTTRENAANAVYIRIVPSQKAKTTASSSETVRHASIEKGDAAFGDTFGRITHTEVKDVKKVTQKILSDQKRRAESLLARRGGVLRQLEIDALPQWHFDADDRINIRWRKRMPDFTELITTEGHYIESIVFPLTPEGTMRIRTRQVVVRQLEQDWEMEPEPTPDYVPPDTPPSPTVPDQPGSGTTPLPPTVVPAPAYQLLEQYKSERTTNFPTWPDNFRYGKITAIHDGDTVTADIYTNSACTTRGTIPHPDGNYGTMRLRLLNLQAHEPSWGTTGAAAEAHLRTLVSVGDPVMIRWDDVREADASGNRRVWVEVYAKQGSTWSNPRNLSLHMIDGGWGFAFPHSDQIRNAKNRIAHMKIAMWYGYGMFATPGAHHGQISIEVTGNPSGADTSKNEFAIIRNKGTRVDLSGWHFGDPSPFHTFTFPAGAYINNYDTIKVFVGPGTSIPGRTYYMGEANPIWNNDGDIAILHDANWRVSALAHFLGASSEQVLIKPTALLKKAAYAKVLKKDVPEIEFPGVGG